MLCYADIKFKLVFEYEISKHSRLSLDSQIVAIVEIFSIISIIYDI